MLDTMDLRSSVKQALETRDGRMLAGLYADDAVVRIVDHNNPPSRPREVRGRSAISTYWDDICSRAIKHRVDFVIAEGDRMAFTQDCTYPDGVKVNVIAVADLRDGKILRQNIVQAWDE